MTSIALKQATKILPQLIHDTLTNCEETVIVTEDGAVVMIDQNEWEAIRETLLLLRDKRSLKSLLEGHRERDQGKHPESVSISEAFHDLSD